MTPQEILDLPMNPNNPSGMDTVRGYLVELIAVLWDEGERFSSEEPFGEGSWKWELAAALYDAGEVTGRLDALGHIEAVDWEAVNKLIAGAIAHLREPT